MSKENTRNEVARYNMDGAGILRVIDSMDRHDEQVEFLDWQLAQREQRIAALESQMGTLCDVAMHYSHYPSEENASCLSAEIKKSHAISTPTATSPATN